MENTFCTVFPSSPRDASASYSFGRPLCAAESRLKSNAVSVGLSSDALRVLEERRASGTKRLILSDALRPHVEEGLLSHPALTALRDRAAAGETLSDLESRAVGIYDVAGAAE